jgi:hypothetical protein
MRRLTDVRAVEDFLTRKPTWKLVKRTTSLCTMPERRFVFPFIYRYLKLNLAEWLERLTANAVVAIVLGSIPASSDTVESEGRQMKQCYRT